MTLEIGTKIRQLRAIRGITQEKLAEYLGVSCQAISKWESQNGYPDIELIPGIANFFNVTTDDILGVDASRNKEEINEYLVRYFKFCDEPLEQLRLMREALAKYPGNFLLLEHLMYALVFNIDLHKDPEFFEKKITKSTIVEDQANRALLYEAVSIAERILRDCLDDGIRHSAIQVLCYYYPIINKKNDAVRLANSMPPLHICRDSLFEEIYTGEEKIRQIQKNIWLLADQLCGNILSVADPDGQQENHSSIDEKIQLIDTANGILRLIFKDDDFYMVHAKFAYHYRIMAALSLVEEKTDIALDYIEKAAEHAIAADTVVGNARCSSPAVNRLSNAMDSEYDDTGSTGKLNDLFYQNTITDRIVIRIEKIAANQSGTLLSKLGQDRYDIIRGTDRFMHAVDTLKNYA